MAFKMKGHPLKRGLYMGANTPYKDYSVEKGSHDHPHSPATKYGKTPAKKNTYKVKMKDGTTKEVTRKEYMKFTGKKPGDSMKSAVPMKHKSAMKNYKKGYYGA